MHRFTRRFSTCVALIAGCAALHANAQDIVATPEVKASGKLTIASSLGYAPFEYVDSNGTPAGLDIELAEAAAKLMGVKLDIVTIPFASQIPSLASRRVKVGWATFSVTKERLSQVDFVTFLSAGTVASTLPENASKFAKKTDLCGKNIAVQTGTSADFAADKLSTECKTAGLPALKKQIYPGQQDTIQSVITKRTDAMLDDSTSSSYYEVTSKGRLKVVPGAYYPTPLGLAVAKGDHSTATMMSSAFQKLMNDGTYASILAKYNMTSSAVTKPEIYTNASQLGE
ncbi:ABC transporter substrate-binding protein [Cupriavidus sp. UYMU48A]|nr:ABC transporter substrate-binding protein [Cupriavidus sp. UYMU48A]